MEVPGGVNDPERPTDIDMRIAVEHVLGMLAAGDSAETVLEPRPFSTSTRIWTREDIQACLLFAHRAQAGERVYERGPARKAS